MLWKNWVDVHKIRNSVVFYLSSEKSRHRTNKVNFFTTISCLELWELQFLSKSPLVHVSVLPLLDHSNSFIVTVSKLKVHSCEWQMHDVWSARIAHGPYLPPASEGWGKVMFSLVSVCLSTPLPSRLRTQRVVCLLGCRRRTFLFQFKMKKKMFSSYLLLPVEMDNWFLWLLWTGYSQ